MLRGAVSLLLQLHVPLSQAEQYRSKLLINPGQVPAKSVEQLEQQFD